jgi:hypothetical protein
VASVASPSPLVAKVVGSGGGGRRGSAKRPDLGVRDASGHSF